MILRHLFRSELLEQEFIQAVDLFNSNEQEDSYSILFQLWRDTKSPNRKFFFQALLQASAALQLLEKKKYCGAQKIYACALKKLIPYASLTKPFNVRQLIFDLIEYFENHNPYLDPIENDMKIVPRPKLLKTA